MKTVFSSRELPHIWAHQSAPTGRSSSAMSFQGKDFYSYGATIGRIESNAKGERAYLVTTQRWSITTSAHQSKMRSAIPYSAKTFHVPIISDHLRILDKWTSEVKNALGGANTSREPKKSRLIGEAGATVQKMREFAEFFAVKKYPFPIIPASKEKLAEAIAKEERAELRRQQARERARQKELEAKRMELTERRNAWLRGEQVDAYGFSELFGTDLRVIDGEVETSRGARVPIDHARRALALVMAVRASGQEWQRNGHTYHVGHYQVDKVTPEGTVYAGCHIIPFTSIERIASQL